MVLEENYFGWTTLIPKCYSKLFDEALVENIAPLKRDIPIENNPNENEIPENDIIENDHQEQIEEIENVDFIPDIPRYFPSILPTLTEDLPEMEQTNQDLCSISVISNESLEPCPDAESVPDYFPSPFNTPIHSDSSSTDEEYETGAPLLRTKVTAEKA